MRVDRRYLLGPIGIIVIAAVFIGIRTRSAAEKQSDLGSVQLTSTAEKAAEADVSFAAVEAADVDQKDPQGTAAARLVTSPTADQPVRDGGETLPATLTPLPTIGSSPTPQQLTRSGLELSELAASTPAATTNVPSILYSDGVDRTCPDPAPAKPDYQHFYLAGQQWSVPEPDPVAHFWLSKPLPGGGRLLLNEWLPYGYDAGGRYLLHNGVDAAEPEGTPLLAAADGTVVYAGSDEDILFGWRCNWYGHLVVIELDQTWHEKPVFVLYGHVLNILVEPGQLVSHGDQIAEVGFGGAALLPHLHFEVRVGSNEFGSTRNPLLWLTPPESRGVISGRLLDPQGRPWQGVSVAVVGRSEGTEDKTTWTYLDDPQHLINPDEDLAENFVIADLRPGQYELYVELQGEIYQTPVNVTGGELVWVEIVTNPFKTPTPRPPVDDSTLPTETPVPEN